MLNANLLLEKSYVPKTFEPTTKKAEAFTFKERLPTMYDLPSEDPEEPGLPDEFHLHQPQLLRETFCPPNYPTDNFFVASDLNLYYDSQHTNWYKRPDWFAVLGVPSSYGKQHDMRYSYVTWDEGVAPFLVVELLSESTKDDDLGKTLRDVEQPPQKWEVYEQILKIPYYVIFSRTSGEWQVFKLQNKRYQQLEIKNERFWFSKIQLGLALWSGIYDDFDHLWLRWYDQDDWIPTKQDIIRKGKQEIKKGKQEIKKGKQEIKKGKQEIKEEKQRADSEAQRANSAEQRANLAEAELIHLKALLAEKS